MCPHTVHAAAARSWHCMRSASVLPTRPACRLPRSVPAPVATATTMSTWARAQGGYEQPEAACPISVLNLIALSWESWLIRPPDTREIPSSSLGESTPPLDLSESFCALSFFLTAGLRLSLSTFLSLPAPVPPLVSRKFLGHPPPEVLRQVRNDHDTQHAQPPTSHLPPLRCDAVLPPAHLPSRETVAARFWIAMAFSNQQSCDVGPLLGLMLVYSSAPLASWSDSV